MKKIVFSLLVGLLVSSIAHSRGFSRSDIEEFVKRQSITIEDLQFINHKGESVSIDEFLVLAEGRSTGLNYTANEDGKNTFVYKIFSDAEVAEMMKAHEADKKKKASFKGKDMPAFRVKDDEQITLSSKDLVGKPTLLNFYFADCAPCVKKVPSMEALKLALSDNVQFISITFDELDIVQQFKQNTQSTWRTLPAAQEIIDSFSVKAYPTMVLIDKLGKIRHVGDVPLEPEAFINKAKHLGVVLD